MIKSGDKYTKLKKEFNESYIAIEFSPNDFKCRCIKKIATTNLHESTVLIGEINQLKERFEKLKFECINEIELFFSFDRHNEIDKKKID